MTEKEKKLIDALPELSDPLTMFDVLEKELEKLQAQLRSREKSTPKTKFLRKAVGMRASKKDVNNEEFEVTGVRLSVMSSLRGGENFVEGLQDNPFDSKARLGLVELFLRKAEGASLLLNRDAYLLAMLEVEQKEVSTSSLQTALLAQKHYLEALQEYLQHKGEEALKNGDNKEQTDSNKLEERKLSRHKWYAQEMTKLLKYKTLDANKTIDLDNLAESGKFRKEDIANPFPAMLEAASGLPLARTVRQRMLKMLEKVSKKTAVGGYYESVLYRKRATQLMLSYVAGNSEVVDPIKRLLQNALASSNHSIKKIASTISPHERIICIREYALVNLTIYQYLPQMGVGLVADDIQRMESAIQMLAKINSEKGIPQLQKKLMASVKEIKGDKKEKSGAKADTGSSSENEPVSSTETEVKESSPKKSEGDGPRKSRKGFFEGEVPQDAEIKKKKEGYNPSKII